MKASSLERQGLKKTMLTAAIVIGGSTLLFQGFTQAAIQTELNKTSTIPTNYAANYTADSSGKAQKGLPEGYKKANYTVGDIDLEFFKNQTPTDKDMAKEDAAEISAQALWEVFGLNLEGQVIQMGYQPPVEGVPRSNWVADVKVDGKHLYEVTVDSVTGEVLSVVRSRTLDEKVSLAFDSALHKNPKEYEDLARKVAEKFDVVHGPIQSVEYNSQGYGDNDPSISIDVTGENGEIALIGFSRYDKALLSISYSASYKPWLEYIEASEEQFVKEMEEKRKELEKSGAPANNNGGVLLFTESK